MSEKNASTKTPIFTNGLSVRGNGVTDLQGLTTLRTAGTQGSYLQFFNNDTTENPNGRNAYLGYGNAPSTKFSIATETDNAVLSLRNGDNGDQDGGIEIVTAGDLRLNNEGVIFGELGENFTGVIQSGVGRNLFTRRLQTQTDGDLTCDGVSDYIIQYTTTDNDPNNNQILIPIRGWNTVDQTQQQSYTVDIFVEAPNANRVFSVLACSTGTDPSVTNTGVHLKNLADTAIGGGFGTSIIVPYSFELQNSVERAGYWFSNTTVNASIHLRARVYGVQDTASAEVLLELVAISNGSTWLGYSH